MQSAEREPKCLFNLEEQICTDIKMGGHHDFNVSFGAEDTRHFHFVSSSYWKRSASSSDTIYFHGESGSSNKRAEKQRQISFIPVILIDPEQNTAPRQLLIQPQNKYNKDEEIT
jgi:hypothetical protein